MLTSGAALAMLLGGGALSAYNTNQVASAQDREAARGIRRQAEIQQRADRRVNEEVSSLESSTNADEKAARTADFLRALISARAKTESGLSGREGGEAFQKSAATAREDLQTQGQTSAGLLAGIDAPALQRQGEAFGYGRLGTDINLLGRESSGQDWITQLRTASIRRNPWLDLGSSLLTGTAMGAAGKAAPAIAWPTAKPPSNDEIIAAMRGYGMG